MKLTTRTLMLSMLLFPVLFYGAAIKEKKENIPYTLSLYDEASAKQITEASKASIRAIGTWGFMHPIHRYENASKVICNLAQLVCDKYPHDTIFALGQSPAYIIERT